MRFRHALVVGKFAPLHKGHQFLIEAALAEAARVTVLCYANPDFPGMPNAVRAGWVRTLYPQVDVRSPADPPPDAAPGATHWHYLKHWLASEGVPVDAVFSSEDYGAPFARALGENVRHRMVDRARKAVAISGSAIRTGIHAHRAWLDPRVYRHFVQRVVFLGAESTGKSTLTEHAAQAFGTSYAAEVGRMVWEQRDGKLDADAYLDIARMHIAAEEEAMLQAHRYLFCDTNALTTLLLGFCYRHIRQAAPELLELAAQCRSRYAHSFVCDDDIAFVQDGWRTGPEWRACVQGMVLHDLQVRGIPFTLLHGTVPDRLAQLRAALTDPARSNPDAHPPACPAAEEAASYPSTQ